MFLKEFKKFAYIGITFGYYYVTEIIMQSASYIYYAFNFKMIKKENSVFVRDLKSGSLFNW